MLKHNVKDNRIFSRRGLFAVALCGALALSLPACAAPAPASATSAPSGAPAESAGGTSSQTDGGATMVNPLKPQADWNAMHSALGFPMAAPNFVQDAAYYVLDGDIAQINFTTKRGIDYTLRGTKRAEDVAGVHGQPGPKAEFLIESGDRETAITELCYPGLANVYTWSWDGVNYTLVATSDTLDLPSRGTIEYPMEMARLCADISANAACAADADAYLRATQENMDAYASAGATYEITVPDKSTLTAQTLLNSGSPLEEIVLDGPYQAPNADPANTTWFAALQAEESAMLVQVDSGVREEQSKGLPLRDYYLLQQAANGNYYIAGRFVGIPSTYSKVTK